MDVIKTLRNFIKTCPYLGEYERFGINWLLEDATNYSIEGTPTERIKTLFIDGSSERQCDFVIAGMFPYTHELESQLLSSGIFEKVADWLELKTKNNELPDLGKGMKATSILALTSGFLYSISSGMKEARHQIQCRLEYFKEA